MNDSTGANVSAYEEIIVHTPAISPGRQPRALAAPGDGDRISVYTFWIYAKDTLPIKLGALGSFDPSRRPPQDIGGLPLVGREELTVQWAKYPDYQEYLQAFDKDEDTLLAFQASSPNPAATASSN
jgi:hypothetical protein